MTKTEQKPPEAPGPEAPQGPVADGSRDPTPQQSARTAAVMRLARAVIQRTRKLFAELSPGRPPPRP